MLVSTRLLAVIPRSGLAEAEVDFGIGTTRINVSEAEPVARMGTTHMAYF